MNAGGRVAPDNAIGEGGIARNNFHRAIAARVDTEGAIDEIGIGRSLQADGAAELTSRSRITAKQTVDESWSAVILNIGAPAAVGQIADKAAVRDQGIAHDKLAGPAAGSGIVANEQAISKSGTAGVDVES